MDNKTIQRLNNINRHFYETTATAFDQTRSNPWPGWVELLKYIPRKDKLTVLDVGCGNGRFGAFLAEELHCKIIYHGMDNNQKLLDSSHDSLTNSQGISFKLEVRDVVQSPPDTGEYDLVVAFGLIHHIPGYIQRQEFVRLLSQRVTEGGILAFACWRFYDYDRFKKRIVPWPDDIEVEKHDYLLDWRRGENALRYCHHVDDEEHQTLINATQMNVLRTYEADGFNLYIVLT